MKQTKILSYRTAYGRKSIIRTFFLEFFYMFSSWFRLVPEVFLRRDMGQRYMSLGAVVIVTILLSIIPFGGSIFTFLFVGRYFPVTSIGWDDLTWYLFTVTFLIFGIMRYRETRLSSTFDFSRFSLSSGKPLGLFYNTPKFFPAPTRRRIETLYEPGLCFLIGLFLVVLGETVGTLIVVCSIFYSLSYVFTYREGDDFILDKIDQAIMDKNECESFVEDIDINGYLWRGMKPNSREDREKFMDSWSELDDDPFDAI